MDATLRKCPTCPVVGYAKDMQHHIRRCAKRQEKPAVTTRKPVPPKPRRPKVGNDPEYGQALRQRDRQVRIAREEAVKRADAEALEDDAAYVRGMERAFYAVRR